MTTLFTRLLGLLLLVVLLSSGRASAQAYDVRTSTINIDRRERPALKVQVEGRTADARAYFQDFMKENYNIKFKTGGVLGLGGNKEMLSAKQTPVSSISGKLLDLYANVVAPTDSTAEIQVFAAFDNGTTWIDPESTASEFAALRTIVNNFARGARAHFLQQQVLEAEKLVEAAEKEKQRLERDTKQAQDNTASNLAKIQQLQQQNEQNAAKIKENETKLQKNAVDTERNKVLLQKRRDRFSALDRK
jgi:hypothetical protein